jgi:hypothetical protein
MIRKNILCVFAVLAIVLLVKCSPDNKKSTTSYSLKGILLNLDGISQLNPNLVVSCDEKLLFYCDKSEHVFTLYNPSNQASKQFGKVGKGPNEFLSVTSIDYDKNTRKIYFLDLMNKQINSINIDSLSLHDFAVNRLKINGKGFFINCSKVNPSLYLIGGAFSSNRFALVNSNGDVKMVGDYNSIGLPNEKFNNFQLGVALQDMVMVHPDGDMFVTNIGHCFEIYQLSNNTIKNLSTINASEQKPAFELYKNKIVKSRKNVVGFLDGKFYGNSILFLFDKRSYEDASRSISGYSNCLKVYNLKGELLSEIMLDYKIKQFDMDNDGNIFALGINDDLEPVVLKYSLPKKLLN